MNYSPNSAAQHANNAAYKNGRNAYVNILHSTKKSENIDEVRNGISRELYRVFSAADNTSS